MKIFELNSGNMAVFANEKRMETLISELNGLGDGWESLSIDDCREHEHVADIDDMHLCKIYSDVMKLWVYNVFVPDPPVDGEFAIANCFTMPRCEDVDARAIEYVKELSSLL